MKDTRKEYQNARSWINQSSAKQFIIVFLGGFVNCNLSRCDRLHKPYFYCTK